MEKIYLSGCKPYIINDCGEGYCLTDVNGYMLTCEEMFDIGTNLVKFSKLHSEKDVEDFNKETRERIESDLKRWLYEPREKVKEKPIGYIYIMECAGKYKIGVSKDIEKRRKQLNNKPFPVNIIYKSQLIKNVYEIEKQIHSIYQQKRIGGEWFDLTNSDIKSIQSYIKSYTKELL